MWASVWGSLHEPQVILAAGSGLPPYGLPIFGDYMGPINKKYVGPTWDPHGLHKEV